MRPDEYLRLELSAALDMVCLIKTYLIAGLARKSPRANDFVFSPNLRSRNVRAVDNCTTENVAAGAVRALPAN